MPTAIIYPIIYGKLIYQALQFASATRKLAMETGAETTCQEASAHQYVVSRAGFSNATSSF